MYQNLFPGHNKITKQILLTNKLCYFVILIPLMDQNNKFCYFVILLFCYFVILMDQNNKFCYFDGSKFVILMDQNLIGGVNRYATMSAAASAAASATASVG